MSTYHEEFAKWANKQHAEGAASFVGSVAADHPTDAQLVALGRKYFKGYDQIADDSARK